MYGRLWESLTELPFASRPNKVEPVGYRALDPCLGGRSIKCHAFCFELDRFPCGSLDSILRIVLELTYSQQGPEVEKTRKSWLTCRS
jgi:hypothetical protein